MGESRETDTRERILNVAQELIQRRGANGFSYQHISEAVGIRKASIHHHFPTKAGLIQALLGRFEERFGEELEAIDAAQTDAVGKLRAYVGLSERTFSQGGVICLCGMLGAELTSLSPESSEQIRAFYQTNEQWLEGVLREGRDAHVLHFAQEPRVLALLIFALLEGGMLIARADAGEAQYRSVTQEVLPLAGAASAGQQPAASPSHPSSPSAAVGE